MSQTQQRRIACCPCRLSLLTASTSSSLKPAVRVTSDKQACFCCFTTSKFPATTSLQLQPLLYRHNLAFRLLTTHNSQRRFSAIVTDHAHRTVPEGSRCDHSPCSDSHDSWTSESPSPTWAHSPSSRYVESCQLRREGLTRPRYEDLYRFLYEQVDEMSDNIVTYWGSTNDFFLVLASPFYTRNIPLRCNGINRSLNANDGVSHEEGYRLASALTLTIEGIERELVQRLNDLERYARFLGSAT